jgi:N6-adenosine-specific RNA methylase IME4
MIEKITLGRRLEYFSREKRNGWEVYGNDIHKFNMKDFNIIIYNDKNYYIRSWLDVFNFATGRI